MEPDNQKVMEWNQAYYRATAQGFAAARKIHRHLSQELDSYFSGLREKRSVLSILDIGTGSGFGLKLARKFFPDAKLVGTDVSAEMLELARKELPSAEFRLSTQPIPAITKNEFDLVLFISSLHHFYDASEVLKKIILELNQPSLEICIMQEPNPIVNRWVNRLRRICSVLPDELTRKAEFHQFETDGLNPYALQKLLRDQGFRVHVTYSNSSLLDELEHKFGAIAILFRPLLAIKIKWFCLSYSLVASREL